MSVFLAAEGGFNPLTPEFGLTFWVTIAFIVVLWGLAKKVLPKMGEGLAERENKIRADLEQAEAQRAEAEGILEQNKATVAQAREEAGRIRQEVVQQGEVTKRETLQKVEEEARAMTEKNLRELEAARLRMISETKGDLGGIAVQLASMIVQKEIDQKAHQQLIDSFIDELTQQGSSPSAGK